MQKTKGNPLRVHSKVHFFKMNYSIGFYTGGGNIDNWHELSKDEQNAKLKKNWYVWWSYRNPKTNKLERQEPNIKLGINIHKTKSKRLKAMNEIKRELSDLLKSGYSPYDIPSTEPELVSIEYAFEKALSVKKNEVNNTTYKDYYTRAGVFKNFLEKNGFKSISEVNKSIVSTFLNNYNTTNSNNFKRALSSLFTIMSEQSFIETNFIKEIRTKKERKKAIRIFTEDEIETITKLLFEQNRKLLLFIDLFSYMFWRPIEVVRINIENIDFENMVMQVNTKGKDGKIKRIPGIIENDLKLFIGNRKSGRLFELNSKDDTGNRNIISQRFIKFRHKNNLDPELKMYHFRHTRITKLYLTLRKTKSKEETIKELSLITGHESKAIWKYISVNDVELPDDYSNLLK